MSGLRFGSRWTCPSSPSTQQCLQQQHGVRARAIDDIGVHASLQLAEVRSFLHEAISARLDEYATSLEQDDLLLSKMGGQGGSNAVADADVSTSTDRQLCALLLRRSEKTILRRWASALAPLQERGRDEL